MLGATSLCVPWKQWLTLVLRVAGALVFTVSHLASKGSVMCEQWKQWSHTGLLPSIFHKDFFLLFGWRFRSRAGSQPCSRVLNPDDPVAFQFQTSPLQNYGWSLGSPLILFPGLQETLLKTVTSEPVERISILDWVDFKDEHKIRTVSTTSSNNKSL